LLDRSNLGGIGAPVASANVSDSGIDILNAAATYRTNQGTYVAFRGSGHSLSTFRIIAASPPTINFPVWSVPGNACGSPFVASTDGTNNMIVWVVGAGGDQRLHGYDGDTGAVIFSGGGLNEMMGGTHTYSTTGIVARGRIYVACDDKVYAFKLPGGTPTPTPTPTVSPTATPTASPTPTATPRATLRSRPTPRSRPAPLPRPAEPIRIVDQNGREVPSGGPRPIPRPRPTLRGRPEVPPPHGTFDVTVGQGFAFNA